MARFRKREPVACGTCGAPLDLEDGAKEARCRFCGETTRFDARSRPPGVPTNRLPLLLVAVVAFTSLSGIASFLLLMKPGTTAASTPVAVPAPAPTPTPTPAAPAPVAPTPVPEETPAPSAAPEASLDVEHGPLTLVWKASVRSSVGKVFRPGTPCTLTAHVTSDGNRVHHDLVSLQCGGEILYDSTVPLEGMSSNHFGLGEEPLIAQAGVYEYALDAEDVGSRSGPRAQLTVNTQEKAAEAFRDSAPSYHVYLAIERDSQTRKGKPLFKETIPAFAGVVKRKAKVVQRSGSVPFSASSCDVVISPAYAEGDTCRVLVTCGGKVMYGAGTSGYAHCLVANGAPTSFVDARPTASGSDPELSIDLVAGTGTLGDTTKSGVTYSVQFSLSP
ncbi:MAG TPA: hypothetical protein VHE30_28475 [Polyangiaceae bacterium]|nr:hypothetical protein [Polyangiaceae bacterium]